jgi:DNA-binding transcriptional MerR regulator
MENIPRLLTTGEIARRLAVPVHRVTYAIQRHGIKPTAFAGNVRLFSVETVKRLSTCLASPETGASDAE